MLAREATAAMRSFPVSGLDGRLGANVTAVAKPELKAEQDDEGKSYTEIKASIGTEEPITCWLYGKRLDAGGFVRSILQHAKGEVGSPEVDVTTHDDGPIVFVEAPIQVDGGRLFAMPKMAIAPRDDGTIACLHDEVGYKKTFRIFVKSLVASSSLRTPEAPAAWVQVSVWKEDGRVAGFVERRVKMRKDERLELFFGAAVLARGGAWSLLDAAGGTATTLDGKLLRSDSAIVLDGAMVSQMHVDRIAEGQFSYAGTSKGKKLEGTLKTKQPLTTELATANKLKALAAGKVAEVRYTTFDDETTGLAEVIYRRDKDGVTKTSGGAKLRVEIDDAGVVRSEADSTRTLERLLSRGSL